MFFWYHLFLAQNCQTGQTLTMSVLVLLRPIRKSLKIDRLGMKRFSSFPGRVSLVCLLLFYELIQLATGNKTYYSVFLSIPLVSFCYPKINGKH